ncbi:MAG: FAD-binding oxidoreductase, partial [Mycobacterium sp.]|nr:FAD-binding oxidoreductase [Mycobacterium sp.]
VNTLAPNATAYVHRKARNLIEMAAGWATSPDPSLPVTAVPPDIREWHEQLWNVLLPNTNGHSYQNFPDPELPDWARSYYGDNLNRLTEVKAAWDPDRVFTYPQAIPLPR